MSRVNVSSNVPHSKQLYQSVIQSSTSSRNTATSNYGRNLLYSSSRRKESTVPRPKSSNIYLRASQTLDSGYSGGCTGLTGSSTSEVSPPLHIYSWEEEEERMPTIRNRVSGSMDRLSRSAFELDIPDIQMTREGRERNRREMHELNEKLADQLDGMRYLSAHNKQLSDEIITLKTRWMQESGKVKEVYDVEMRQLRQLLDDAEREKAESLSKLLSAQQANRNQADQLSALKTDNEKYARKLEQAFDDLNKRDGDLTMLQRRLDGLEQELEKERRGGEKMKCDNEALCQHLDEETVNRMSGQSEMQTLREELEFQRRAHQEEIQELQAGLESEAGRVGMDQEMWQNEMAQAVRDIQLRYDVQLDKLRNDMEEMYNARLRELSKPNPEDKAEIKFLKSENVKLRQNSDNLREQISQLQSKNSYIEGTMQEVCQEAADLRRRSDFELGEAAREREAAEEALSKAHNEMASLMDVKLNLEAEIQAYSRLLDTQSGIISGGGLICGGGRESMGRINSSTEVPIRRSRDLLPRPRPSSLSPQRRRTTQINSQAPPLNAPLPVSDIAGRFPERSGSSNSLIRPRMSRYEDEGDQQLSCSYKSDSKNMRAELTARTQFDKSYKGAISIDECSPDGRYIVITNTGENLENLNGWRLVRSIDHGKQIIRYTFKDAPMPPKSSLKIWAKGQRASDASPRDLESLYSTWGVGSYIYTTLFTMNGEERATHAQRSEFNLN